MKPKDEMKLSDLLRHIGANATMAIWRDTDKAQFVTHMPTSPEASPSNVMVKGGAGYIVMMKELAEVTFEGNAW